MAHTSFFSWYYLDPVGFFSISFFNILMQKFPYGIVRRGGSRNKLGTVMNHIEPSIIFLIYAKNVTNKGQPIVALIFFFVACRPIADWVDAVR